MLALLSEGFGRGHGSPGLQNYRLQLQFEIQLIYCSPDGYLRRASP